MKTVLSVLLIASICVSLGDGLAIRSRRDIASDVARLERDIAALEHTAASASDDNDNHEWNLDGQSALSTSSAKDRYDPLEDHFKGQPFSIDIHAPVSDYFRGSIDGQKMDFILTTKRKQGFTTYELNTYGSNTMGMGGCHPRGGSRDVKLMCRISGKSYTLEPLSTRGLLVYSGSDNSRANVFWAYDKMRTINVDLVVASASEFLQVYLSEIAESMGGKGRARAEVDMRFGLAKDALIRSLKQYQSDWERKKPAKAAAELKDDKETLDSLVTALEAQFESMAKWAKKMSEVYDSTEVDTTPFTFQQAKRVIPTEAKSSFADFARSAAKDPKSRETVELSESSSKILRSGTDAGGKAVGKVLKGLLDGQNNADADKMRKLIDSGKFGKAVSDSIFNDLSTKEGLVEVLNDADAFAVKAEEVAAKKVEEIGNWFKGLVGLNKKKEAAERSIPDGSLKPGENQVVTAVFDAKAKKDAKAVAAKAEKLQIKGKFRFKHKLDSKAALTNILAVVKSVDVGYNLKLSKGKSMAVFDMNLKVDKPLDPKNARATLVVKVDAQHTTANGGVINAGLSGRAEVIGLYKTPQVEEVVLASYVKYRSKDSKLTMGFFGTLRVPMNDNAIARTHFKTSSPEVHLRANLDWTSQDDRTKFTAYADFKSTFTGKTQYSSGLRLEHKLKDNIFLYGDVGVEGNSDHGFSNGRTGGRAMFGIKITF